MDDKAIKVTATIDQTSFARARAAAGRLGGTEEVDLRANVEQTSFAKARAAMDSLSSGGKGVGSVFDQANLSFGQWAVGLGSALPVIIDVTAALGALTASASAAAAGAGALAVGGGAAGAVGIGGIASVAAPAIASLKDLKTAQDAYTLAVQQYGRHSTQAQTAFSKLRVEQKRAGPEAAKFASSIRHLASNWKQLTQSGQRDFFGLLNDGIARVNQKLPMLAKSANTSMNALRAGFDQFLKKATGPEFNKFIDVMTRTFAHSQRALGDMFGNIAKILERIAVAVGPDVVRIIKQLDDVTKGWVQSTKDASGLRDTIHGLVNQTETWAKLIVQTGKLIVAVLVPGMGQGQKAVKGITATLKEWTDWVNAHPAQMRDFFKQGLETTKELFQVLVGFLPMLLQISQAMRPIARAFLAIAKGLNSLKIGNISALTALLGVMVGAKLVTGIAGLVKSINTIREAWLGVRGAAAGAAAAETAAGAAGAGGAVGAGASAKTATGRVIGSTAEAGAGAAGATWGTRFASAAKGKILPAFGGIGLAISALIVAQPILDRFRGIAQKAADEFPQPFKDIGNQIADFIPKGLLPTIPKHPGGILGLLGVGGNDAVDKVDELAHSIRGADKAVQGLDKSLPGVASKTVGEAIKSLREKYGSLVVAGHNMSKSQRQAFIDLAEAARNKGLITQRQLEQVTNSFDNNTSKWRKMMQKAADATGQSVKSIVRSTQGMKVKVSDDYKGMVEVTGGGIRLLAQNTNQALQSLGVAKSKFMAGPAAHPGHGQAGTRAGTQRGGHIDAQGVPPIGDHIPAMLEKGEFVVNSKATRKHRGLLEKINFQDAPRFATGGFAGMQPGITRLAKSMIQRFGGYLSSGLRPGDPGFHGRGMAADIVPAKWGAATRYANAIGPRLLEGIHQGPPGQNVSWDSGHKVSPGFWGGATWAEHVSHIHLAIAGAAKGLGGAIAELKRVVLRGPKGALRDMGQGSLDKTYEAAKAYLAKQQPALSTDTALIQGSGNVERVFAKVAKKLSRSKTATLALGEAGFAESGMRDLSYGSGSSQGALQLLASTAAGLGVSPHDEGAVASIFFTRGFAGRGGANALAAQGLPAYQVAQGVQGSADASGSNYRAQEGAAKSWMRRFGLQKGGVVGPYVGSFAKGGQVAETGLAHVHKGETVVPGMQRGGLAPTFPRGLIRALRQLVHLTPAHDRQERRAEMHLLQRIAHASGPRQLNLISKALDKFGVNFTKAEQKRLQKLAHQQRHGGLTHPQHRELHHLRQERRASHEQAHIRRQIEVERELLTEFKQLRGELKEHNRLVKSVRVNEKAALNAVVNLTSSQIGAQGLQKTRNASPGRAARY